MRKMLVFCGILAVFAAPPSLAQAAGDSPFGDLMRRQRLALPTIISLDEITQAAMNYAMTKDDVTGLFAQLEIPLKGEAGRQYVLAADLLRGCGADCNAEDGLGYILRGFLYPADLYR